MSYKLEFEVKGLPKSPNRLLGSAWRTRMGQAKYWERAVWKQVWMRKPVSPLKKASVTLTRCSSTSPDYDGLVGSFKFPLDALVKCGILEDDNPKVIVAREYKHERVGPGKGFIRIKVEEVL